MVAGPAKALRIWRSDGLSISPPKYAVASSSFSTERLALPRKAEVTYRAESVRGDREFHGAVSLPGTRRIDFRNNGYTLSRDWEMACAESILPKRDLAPDAPAVAAE